MCPTHWAEIPADPLSLITVADRRTVSIFTAIVLELRNVFRVHRRGREKGDVLYSPLPWGSAPVGGWSAAWALCSIDLTLMFAMLLCSFHLSIFPSPIPPPPPQPAMTGMGLLLPNHVPCGIRGQRGGKEGGGKCVDIGRCPPLICEDQAKNHGLYPFLVPFPHFRILY